MDVGEQEAADVLQAVTATLHTPVEQAARHGRGPARVDQDGRTRRRLRRRRGWRPEGRRAAAEVAPREPLRPPPTCPASPSHHDPRERSREALSTSRDYRPDRFSRHNDMCISFAGSRRESVRRPKPGEGGNALEK